MLVESSCGEQIELLRERRLQIVSILRLSFPHHVDHFNPTQDHAGAVQRLESEHRPDPPLDRPMILLDTIVQVGTLPDANRLLITPCSILESIGSIAGEDRFTVCLAAVDHDPSRPSMSLKRLAQESLGGRQITSLAEPKLDRIAVAVDGAVEILPLAPDFDVDTV
jgi:hypothetical protein